MPEKGNRSSCAPLLDPVWKPGTNSPRIFGSQIAALKRLNEVGRATVDDAREFFRPYAEQFPQLYNNYGFDGWLGFLKGGGLIVQNGNVLEISDFGRDFLIYLTERRLAENKPW